MIDLTSPNNVIFKDKVDKLYQIRTLKSVSPLANAVYFDQIKRRASAGGEASRDRTLMDERDSHTGKFSSASIDKDLTGMSDFGCLKGINRPLGQIDFQTEITNRRKAVQDTKEGQNVTDTGEVKSGAVLNFPPPEELVTIKTIKEKEWHGNLRIDRREKTSLRPLSPQMCVTQKKAILGK